MGKDKSFYDLELKVEADEMFKIDDEGFMLGGTMIEPNRVDGLEVYYVNNALTSGLNTKGAGSSGSIIDGIYLKASTSGSTLAHEVLHTYDTNTLGLKDIYDISQITEVPITENISEDKLSEDWGYYSGVHQGIIIQRLLMNGFSNRTENVVIPFGEVKGYDSDFKSIDFQRVGITFFTDRTQIPRNPTHFNP